MSVDRSDYIVVGVDIGSIDKHSYNYNEEEFDDFCDNYFYNSRVGDMVFLDDVYDGEYFIIGEILQSSHDYDGSLDFNFFGTDKVIEYAKMRVKAFVWDHFGIDTEPSVIVKTQYY